MAHFTKNMRERLFAQGWKFSHDYYDYITGETTIYSNKNFPGVYIMESGFGRFVIYSDNVYKTETEKIQEAYEQGLANGERRGFIRGFNNGYFWGFKHGKESANKTGIERKT